MKKRFFAALLALVLSFAFTAAFAANSTIESLEYKGFGILELEFRGKPSWYPDAVFTLSDGLNTLSVTPFAGEEDNAFLYAPELIDGSEYTLSVSLNGSEESITFTADTSLEYKFNKNGELNVKEDKERCDYCREPGHDEDFCPERVNPGDIPADPESMAWYFDIDDFCEICGGIGHDDDRCPNR